MAFGIKIKILLAIVLITVIPNSAFPGSLDTNCIVHTLQEVSTSDSRSQNKAAVRPSVIYLERDNLILKDPVGSTDPLFFLRINEIRARSGRLGKKFVKTLQPLEGSKLKAFDGPPKQELFKPGRIIWQVQRTGQGKSGSWFSTSIPINRLEADKMFNIAIWDNDGGQTRMFVVKEEFSAYVGKVEGGIGDQILIPDSTQVQDVVESVSYRLTPGGQILSQLDEIPIGKPIEVTFYDPNNPNHIKEIVRGEFGGLSEVYKSGHRYISIDTGAASTEEFPFSSTDEIIVREIPERVQALATNPISDIDEVEFNFNSVQEGTLLEIPWVHFNQRGEFVETRIRGKYLGIEKSSAGKRDDVYFVLLEAADGKKIKIPADEVDEWYVTKIRENDFFKPVQLAKHQTFISNIKIGDKVSLDTLEKSGDGKTMPRTHHGTFEGLRGKNYLAIRRPGDIVPILVKQQEVVNQVATIHSSSARKINIIEVEANLQTRVIALNSSVSVTYSSKGIEKTVFGILTYSNHKEIILRTASGNEFKIDQKSIVKDGIVQVRRKIDFKGI